MSALEYTATESILEQLTGYATVSRDSNLELIHYVRDLLDKLGIESSLISNEEGTKANLYATIGPLDQRGIMLSGHTDVVPIDGQTWSFDPFRMTIENDRLYGRGTTDMKGFIASVLAMLPEAVKRNLNRPIHLAFSYDEEIGCVGVRKMLDMLESAPVRPEFCIVGEPTGMQVGIGHKGKTGATCICYGVEAHSALATKGLNAIHLATEMIQTIRGIQEGIRLDSHQDYDYSVPYSTLHVGTIHGGTALNIIPRECRFEFEIRNLSSDDPHSILQQVREAASAIVSDYREDFPRANIEIEVFNQYPALDTSAEEPVVQFVQGLMDSKEFIKLAFGTEGGLFQHRLDVPTVICGPGSMDQGHKPDEYISRAELRRCDQFLGKLLDKISD